ncbi:MAG: DNA mismatch repair protein MutS [Alphaproteobacteria bacterium]|nr:DNA mismatch repair protein MutS [Alphaproteobacteria bacterium]
MMAQYLEIKAANPDCLLFYRMGDFYELFFADAEAASRALGIVLTKRGRHNGDDIPMCGVPVERADDYLQRLIALGHRVAVCEQMENPAEARKRGAKSVVRRDVVRLVTPGTITEERLLEPGRANWFAAIARVRESEDIWVYGLAGVEISTGAFVVCEMAQGALGGEIARLEPSEIIVAASVMEDAQAGAVLTGAGPPVVPVARETGEVSNDRRLEDYFGVATLDGFGQLTRAERAAASLAISYIERTQAGQRPPLSFPQRRGRGEVMEIDAATRANLEITRTLAGKSEGSLVSAIDMTLTPSGGRLLAARIASPLMEPQAIAQRLDGVEWLIAHNGLREDIRLALRAAPDFARALSRLALQRGGPRDLASIREGLTCARDIAAVLNRAGDEPPVQLAQAASLARAAPPALIEHLSGLLAQELPLNRRDGNFVREGFNADLDELRALRDASRKVIASLQARYASETGVKTLRIKHNNMLGYFLEVPQAAGENFVQPPLNATFIHRQTMAGAMRFTTTELGELESKIASAADRALALELDLFDSAAARTLEQAQAIKDAADALAMIDVCASNAELAVRRNWSRPLVDGSLTFIIEGGRHPVVEAALARQGKAFVANACTLGVADAQAGQLAIVTGPNMAGKSIYLRQNALIAILAQAGCYVPAANAHIGAVDRLFSRVGAADDLARGRSTFMVEMVETAAILNQAGLRSLVILDEIGRGTATFDGLSIAWAALEYLHEINRSRTLFATHFHELTQLAAKLPRLVNLTMRVTDWKGEVIFLHEVAHGAADRSYGIQVARLAGLPRVVLERAQHLLAQFEDNERARPGRIVDDLPLFAAAARTTPAAQDAGSPAVLEALAALSPDEMSPREALDALYELRRLAAAQK